MKAAAEELFSNHAGLAQVISLEYTNIPMAQPTEIFAEAQQALFRAAQGFDPARGEFGPYAARAIRNALNTLYAKQLRFAKVFPKSLDEPPNWAKFDPLESASDVAPAGSQDSKQDVFTQVRRRETGSILEEVLRILSPRDRIVVDGIRRGQSLSEIGKTLGVSKQAAHKVSTAAIAKLHSQFARLGYQGVDSKGFLKSAAPGRDG